ncbi:MAG: sensor histidine kinase [Burkholderiaceae bacterium]|nr:sensor histidine kinase [Burkholderiaceae bacterium]
MMLSANLVLAIALLYVALLFAVAFAGDRRARMGRLGWLQSPLVYTLSISVYCTSWTFYGAVGSAARNGLEFATIYLGPTLVFVGWWVFLRKIVRIGHVHGITSIADMISSRYGKSPGLAALVTLIAVVGTTPYIALQLRAVTVSFQVIGNAGPDPLSGHPAATPDFRLGFWIAVGMAVFTILFGTRNIDAKERHHGVVAAIALEAVVKLVALIAVGLMVVYGISEGPAEIFARASPEILHSHDVFGPRWVAVTLLSAAAIVCLPREFQVAVVENTDERHLRTASWLFPLYLFLISLFVLPIAIAGLNFLPEGSNPDMFVLTLPMWARQEEIALLAFLGGFSSATSMVIVACIALSTMVSNHLIMPVALRFGWVSLNASGEIRRFLLSSRRASICLMLLLGYLYFRVKGNSDALASIGLISFAGVAQVMPSLVGGLFWRRANADGALAGLAAGALLWAYTLFLPSFGGDFIVSSRVIADGLFGLPLLRPHALFGLDRLDPLMHSLFWSLSLNTLLFVLLSLWREPQPLERLQSTLFVDVFRTPAEAASGLVRRSATTDDLSLLAQRILGSEEATRLFRAASRAQGRGNEAPVANDAFITQLERKLAGSIGAASAHAMISQVVTGETISLDALMKIADETQRVREYSRQLEEKSRQLEATARQLSDANERLTRLDAEKDDFLSQVSHEVRTPMTSIRSFSEILLDSKDLDPAQADRFVRIIHEESIRLTRLLDSILDLSLLERGEAPWQLSRVDPELALENSIRTCQGLAAKAGVRLLSEARARDAVVEADGDRLSQVFINLLSNAIKYNTSSDPWVRVRSRIAGQSYEVLVEDNGPGIRPEERELIFSKFLRGWAHTQTSVSGAGLGLAISWQIMRRLGGSLTLVPGTGTGACFRVALPLATATADTST